MSDCIKTLLPPFRVMLVTNCGHLSTTHYLQHLDRWLHAGVDAIQVREKALDDQALLKLSYEIKELAHAHGAKVIINDKLQLAKKTQADGVHLGQQDGCPLQAREYLGPNALVGISARTAEQINRLNHMSIHYVGLGSVFPTQSKSNATVIGPTTFHQLAALSKHPVVAIGGMSVTNTPTLQATTPCAVAGISLFQSPADPHTIQQLTTFQETRPTRNTS